MANITLNSTFSDGIDNSSTGGQFTATLTSSNWLGGNEIIGNGWTQLSFNSGSLTSPLAFYVKNDTTIYSSSIVAVATGSAGQGVFCYLYPGQQVIIGWSGSVYNNNQGVYVSVVGVWPYGGTTPTSGSVGWKVQQA